MCINGLKWICYLYYICSMYIFIYYFLIVFKNKTLNTSFWRVENVEYVNQSASISIKNVSILDLPVGVFTPQSLMYFSFVIYEVAIWLICHLIRIGGYDPTSINDMTLTRLQKEPRLHCFIDALGQTLSSAPAQHGWLPKSWGALLICFPLWFLCHDHSYRKQVVGTFWTTGNCWTILHPQGSFLRVYH